MSSEAYQHLANYYDRLMDEDYEAWARYLVDLLLSFGSQPKNILELGCGTGSITWWLSERGLRVTGVDRSEAMLAVARGKLAGYPWISLQQQDMTTLKFPDAIFDTAICACDGFNYLITEEELLRTLTGLWRVVQAEGMLLFDLNSAAKLQDVYGDNSYAELFEDFGYFWDNHWNEDAQQTEMKLTFFVPEPKGLYQRVVEHHIQKLWTPAVVTEALSASGWDLLGMYGFLTFDEPASGCERWQFIARRRSVQTANL